MRAPGLSVALLLTIAVGVGSNAAIYGFLQGLTHPASLASDALGMVSIFGMDRFGEAEPLSLKDFRLLEKRQDVFAWVGAAQISPRYARIKSSEGIFTVAGVTPSLSSDLGIPLDKGAVISHRIWENKLDGKEIAAGATIRVDLTDLTIAGVAPERLAGLYSDQSVDVWIPSRETDLGTVGRDRRDLWVLAGLRPGVSIQQAQAALGAGSAALGEVSVAAFTGIAPDMARGLARVALFLNLSAGAVFLIACINVASFLLGRALRRSHETSLRIALGATRRELLRDLFSDSVVLSVAGGMLGVLLGMATAHVIPALLFEEDAERLSFAPHLLPILAASVACVAVTVACGMLPVLGTVTDRPWMVLQRETGSPSRAILRLRSGLVVGQITACCMLVLCSALLLEGLHAAMETSAGHRLGNPILVTVQARQRPDGPEVDPGYFKAVEQKTKSMLGVQPLAWTAQQPGSRPTWQIFRMQPASQADRDTAMDVAWLTPGSFEVLDRQPAAGRMFTLSDEGRKAAMVNEKAAAEIYGLQSVGMTIQDSSDAPIEIIGVVKSTSDGGKDDARPTIYYGYLDATPAPRLIADAKFRIPTTPPAVGVELNANVVSADYFRALGMPMISGQELREGLLSGQGRVAVINQEGADLYFNGKPLGAGVIDENGVRTRIVGVVRSQALGTFEQHAEPAIYFPMGQDLPSRMTLIVKDTNRNKAAVAELQKKIEDVPGRAPTPVVMNTLDTRLAQSGLAPLRIATLIGGASAVIALMLSILGLLSAQNDAERQRQRERGIQIALGAQRWRVVLTVMRNAGRLALAGAVMGTLLSLAMFRFLIAGIAFGASPPLGIWLMAPLLPVAAVLMASVIPARRASVVSPAAIMREQ